MKSKIIAVVSNLPSLVCRVLEHEWIWVGYLAGIDPQVDIYKCTRCNKKMRDSHTTKRD